MAFWHAVPHPSRRGLLGAAGHPSTWACTHAEIVWAQTAGGGGTGAFVVAATIDDAVASGGMSSG